MHKLMMFSDFMDYLNHLMEMETRFLEHLADSPHHLRQHHREEHHQGNHHNHQERHQEHHPTMEVAMMMFCPSYVFNNHSPPNPYARVPVSACMHKCVHVCLALHGYICM